MKRIDKILFLLVFSFVVITCRKSLEKKLAGKWEIEAAFVNSIDKTVDLNSFYIQYYEFNGGERSSKGPPPLVTVAVDTIAAHWDDACKYEFGNLGEYDVSDDKKQLTMPYISAVWDTTGGIMVGWISTCQKDIFLPMFITGSWEIWTIKKWKRNELWLSMDYNGNSYECRLKKMK